MMPLLMVKVKCTLLSIEVIGHWANKCKLSNTIHSWMCTVPGIISGFYCSLSMVPTEPEDSCWRTARMDKGQVINPYITMYILKH